jgi:GNAT superfamily N-acetyltransferase
MAMAGMLITLRLAELSDVRAMAAIRAQQWQTEPYWANRIGSYLMGEHFPQQALPARAAFVALDGEELIGSVAGHRTRRRGCDGELQWINVIEERRGLGIADKLIAKIGAWFVEQSANRICVNVTFENVAARKVYTRCGVQPLDDGWMAWEDSRAMVRLVDV